MSHAQHDPPEEDARLHWLAQRGAEGMLSGEERAELSRRLAGSEAARNLFAGYCQLLVLLEREPCVMEILDAADRPRNVVPMPGLGARRPEGIGSPPEGGWIAPPEAGATSGPPRWRRAAAMLVFLAAALGAEGLSILWAPRAETAGGIQARLPALSDRGDSGTQPSASVAPGEGCQRGKGGLVQAAEVAASPESAFPRRASVAGVPLSVERDLRPLLADTCLRCHVLKP